MFLAKITGRLIGIGVSRFRFRLRDVRGKSGTLARLQNLYWDMAEFREYLIAEPTFQMLAENGLLPDRTRTYLIKAATSGEPGQRGTVNHSMFMVRVCAWENERQNSGAVPVLFIGRIAWFESLRRYAATLGVSVTATQPGFNLSTALRRLLPAKIEYILRLARHRRTSAVVRVLFGRQSADLAGSPSNATANGAEQAQKNVKAMIAIEGVGPPHLDRIDLQSDLFFWQQSSLAGANILATFGIPHAPLDDQAWDEYQSHDMSAIALHPAATTVPSAPVLTTVHEQEWSLDVPQSFFGYQTELKWVKEQISNYHRLKALWQGICIQYNVKVFLTQAKYDASHCAIADALKATGGIAAVYQRAFESQAAVETTIDADIVFGFSPKVAEVERLSGSEIPYHVATGFPADHRFPHLKEDSKALREKLEQNGAKHIIAFFDENSMDDERWHTGHPYMQENFNFLLQKVLSNPWFGLVIKPKIPRNLRNRLGAVAETLKQAEDTGRCYVYDDDSFRGVHTPAAAALAADVAVHSHLSGGTAAMEAALAGIPSLLMDRDGWSVSPLHQLREQPVAFSQWDDLWNACIRHWFDEPDLPGFGDWSPMMGDFDPFQDGRAAERMGTYLQWLVEGFESGQDRETIMAEAAKRYCDLWGTDKITQVTNEPITTNQ